jgi:tight adherence protein C
VRLVITIAAFGLLVGPLLAIVVGSAAVALSALRRRRLRGTASDDAESAVLLLADVLALGLSSGLPPLGALREAAVEVPLSLRVEVEMLLRRTSTMGASSALATWEGSGERLFRLMARASLTGAPLLETVEAFAREVRHEAHARAQAAARRLPVKLLVPLAFLILPGFVVLVVGPALVGSLARLDIAP